MVYDTEYTDEPVCPHCGCIISDAWDITFGNQECTIIDCDDCDKGIEVCRNISTSYNTYKEKKVVK